MNHHVEIIWESKHNHSFQELDKMGNIGIKRLYAIAKKSNKISPLVTMELGMSGGSV